MERPEGRRRRTDPWEQRGWRTGGRATRVAGIVAAALAVPALLGVYLAAEEWQFEAYEKQRYVVATGVAGPDEPPYDVVVSAPEIGSVRVDRNEFWDYPEPGERVRVKLNRRDPSDYLAWEERARPWQTTAIALAFVAASAAALGVAAILVRRGVLDASYALDAAAPPMEPEPPRGDEVPENLTAAAPPIGPAFLLGGVVGLAVILAIPTGIPQPTYRTADGRVVILSYGPEVVFYDEVLDGPRSRPMTTVEARGRRDGDTFPVTYAYDPGDGMIVPNPPNLLLGGVWSVAVGLRRLRWRRALNRLPTTRPDPVAVAGWVRVHRGTRWLALAPYESTRVRDVVLVPLYFSEPVPDALRSILRVRGRLRGGGAVLVHSPDGVALWPVGRARGAVAGALLGPSPWAPVPPDAPPPPESPPARPGRTQAAALPVTLPQTRGPQPKHR